MVLPGGEIYTALERRVIDANEFVTPATNIKMGFHKVAKYIIMPGLHSPSHMNEATFKLETWNKLPKRIRDQISAAGQLSAFQTAMAIGIQDLDAVEKLMAGKNTWITLDAAAQAKIEELGRAWSAEQAKKRRRPRATTGWSGCPIPTGASTTATRSSASTGITRPADTGIARGGSSAPRVLRPRVSR